MTSYVVMTGREGPTGETTRFVKDGFIVFAFALPLVWLLWKKLWLEAALYFAAIGILGAALYRADLANAAPLSALITFGLNLVVGLEGGSWLKRSLESAGFSAADIVVARNERQAEEMYASRMVSVPIPYPSRAVGVSPSTSLIPLTGNI
jgi:Protein of unknown function (DUF2628)